MIKNILSNSLFRICTLLLLVTLSVSACKSKKKVADVTSPEITNVSESDEDEDAKAAEEAARIARENAAKKASNIPVPVAKKISNYLDAISTAPSINSANTSIMELLGMFESKNTPVLIVIYDDGVDIDYDEPTTIEKYLNYLKDQKKNPNGLRDYKTNAAGKITELELGKK
jgi:hypothetical protein